MTTVSGTDSTSSSTSSDAAARTQNSLNNLDLDTFLQLMMAELQNQDPLQPMDNSELLSQISQIREVGATDKLTDTLDSVLLGQNIASATNLIGAQVSAISDDGQSVNGTVDRVSVDEGIPKLRLQLATQATPTSSAGEVEPGTYSYRVIWQNDDGEYQGLEFSGDNAVTVSDLATNSGEYVEQSVELTNLPSSDTRKEVYRTDKTGEGNYQLVGIIDDGSQSSFVDHLSDAQRNLRTFSGAFESVIPLRTYIASLSNVSEIRPPASTQ